MNQFEKQNVFTSVLSDIFLKRGHLSCLITTSYTLHMFLPLVFLPKVAHICWNKTDERNHDKSMNCDMKT